MGAPKSNVVDCKQLFSIVFYLFSRDSVAAVFFPTVNNQTFDFQAVFGRLWSYTQNASRDDRNTVNIKWAKYRLFTTVTLWLTALLHSYMISVLFLRGSFLPENFRTFPGAFR